MKWRSVLAQVECPRLKQKRRRTSARRRHIATGKFKSILTSDLISLARARRVWRARTITRPSPAERSQPIRFGVSLPTKPTHVNGARIHAPSLPTRYTMQFAHARYVISSIASDSEVGAIDFEAVSKCRRRRGALRGYVCCKRRLPRDVLQNPLQSVFYFLSCTRRLRTRINPLARPGHVRFFPGLS